MTFTRKPMLRRTGFKRPEYVRAAPAAPVRATRAATYAKTETEIPVSVPKTERAPGGVLEQLHKARLVELGCMCCRMTFQPITPDVELHHLRAGQGWGKGDWMTLMPLCWFHHQGPLGVHGLGTRGFPKHYGFTEQDMLDKALQLLNITPKGQGEDA